MTIHTEGGVGPAGRPQSSAVPEFPRFSAVMDEAVRGHALVLVAAPSGFGRSAATAQWAGRTEGSTWVRVDPCGSTAEQIDRAVRELAGGERGGAHSAADKILAGVLAAARRPRVLVLADAHLLDPAELGRVLCSDVVLGSGRLRVVLVGTPTLARDHARQLVTGVARLVDHRNLVGGEAVAGPWPLPDPARAEEISARLLAGLDPRLRAFVRDAAFLPFLDAELLAQVAGAGSASALEGCLAAGLPLTPASCRDGQVRLHWQPAFAARCRADAFTADAARARAVESAAVHALLGADTLAAATLAARSGDGDRAAAILGGSWMGLLLDGAVQELEAACRELPGGRADEPDIIRIRAACGWARAGAEPLTTSGPAPRGPALHGDPTAFANLLLSRDRAELRSVLDSVEPLVDGLPDALTRLHAGYLSDWARSTLQPGSARGAGLLVAVEHEAMARGSAALAAHARLALAVDDAAGGRFTAALSAIASARAVLGSRSGHWTAARLRAGDLAEGLVGLWRGENLAVLESMSALRAAGAMGPAQTAQTQILAGHAALALGRWDLLRICREVDATADGVGSGLLDRERRLLAAELCLADGSIAEAVRLAESVIGQGASVAVLARSARVLRTAGRRVPARAAMTQALGQHSAPHVRASALVAAALLDLDLGKADAARRALDTALELAAPESAWLPFLSTDDGLADALADLARVGSQHEAALSEIFTRRIGPVDRGLTLREREILGYLRTALTLGEISERLQVAPSTMKTHSRAIYRKLGVRDRRELRAGVEA